MPADATTALNSDGDIVEYWSIVCADPEQAAYQTLRTDGISSKLIVATVNGTNPTSPQNPRAKHAAGNRATPVELLERWVRTQEYGLATAERAAENPTLGPRAAQLWDEVPRDAGRWLLGNPGADPEFLAEHWEEAPARSLPNPATPAYVIAEAWNLYPAAVAHPAIDEAVLLDALESVSDSRRAYAARNPRLGEGQLTDLLEEERYRPTPSTIVQVEAHASLDRIERANGTAHWTRDPLSCPAGDLLDEQPHREVHRHLLALDANSRTAVAALTAAGFEGTVGELLAVAASVTS